mgnify:CR=1 FL=1
MIVWGKTCEEEINIPFVARRGRCLHGWLYGIQRADHRGKYRDLERVHSLAARYLDYEIQILAWDVRIGDHSRNCYHSYCFATINYSTNEELETDARNSTTFEGVEGKVQV